MELRHWVGNQSFRELPIPEERLQETFPSRDPVSKLPIRERGRQEGETQRQSDGNWEKRSEKNSHRNKENVREKEIR